MSAASLYLRPDVVAEPLVDQWYAWPHLIAPATAALNVANRHVRIMESYLSAPDVHAMAAHNPALRGGPFMGVGAERAVDVRALLSWTMTERKRILELADALQTLTRMLRTQARGDSLEPLYAKVPAILRGYVELVYDLENNPTIRLLEPLLYRSPYYVEASQGLLLARASRYHRAFILSTPRFATDEAVHVRVPFSSDLVDHLFSAVRQPLNSEILEEIRGLGVNERQLASLLSDRAPPARRGAFKGVRWRYFGHACVLIESATCSILLDPAFGYADGSASFQYTSLDLPERIDYVLITHAHQDHCMLEMLLQLRHRIHTIVVPTSGPGVLQDPSLKLLLNNIGFKRVTHLDVLECVEFVGGSITAVPFLGEHGDLDIRSKSAYLVRFGDRSLLFGADSRNVEPALYEILRGSLGPVDTLFIGMECDGAPVSWSYGALFGDTLTRTMDQSRRTNGSDYGQVLAMVEALACERIYVYAMGQEPWFEYVSGFDRDEHCAPLRESARLIEECRRRGLLAERLYGHKEVVEC